MVFLHLGLGSTGVGSTALFAVLAGTADPATTDVVLGARLPRTLSGLVVGLALGVAGTLVQGVTRNPLAAPDTLGINAGAYAAVALSAVLGLDAGLLGQGGAALAGALLAGALVYLFTLGGVATPGRVLLAGAGITLAGTAIAEFLQILEEQSTAGLFFWGNGTLLAASLDRPLVLGAVILGCLLLVPLLVRPLDLLALGDGAASALGLRVDRVRPAALLLTVLLAAACVTLAGPIGFVGIVAPVAVRALGVRRHALLIPLAGAGGAVLLLGADAVAQTVLPASAGYGELPVGVVTALVGGPVFVLLARRVVTGDVETGAAVTTACRHPRRGRAAAAVVAVLLVLAVLFALRTGDVAVEWGRLVAALVGSGDALATAVVDLRLPRILVAALAGACLAVAGVAVQAVVRNPLAEPGLLGITGGASALAVVVIGVVPGAPAVLLPLAAGVGGLAAVGVVMALARTAGTLDPTRVVLVGLGIAATTTAVVNMVVVGAQFNAASALSWLAGSSYARDYSALSWLVLPVLAAIVVAVARRPVNMLPLGDDLPRALGLSLRRTRTGVLVAGAVLAAGAASAIGTVGFVGLVAPHLARPLVGNDTRRLIVMAALLGALLVVVADGIGRTVLAPAEIPVGVVTAVVGAPYLVWLLRRTAAG